jgi:broad specificity phosphatase PhoE
MKLVFIRHADPDYGTDSLTPRGHVQARLLAEALLTMPIDAIYVSPRGRAQLTAAYTLERRGEPGATLDWLAELHGLYAPGKVAWDTHPVDLVALEESITLREWPNAVVYGEQLAGVLQPFYKAWDVFLGENGYVRQGLRYRVEACPDETLAFFCHAGVTLSLLAHLLHIAPPLVYAHFGCDPSSVTILESDEREGWASFRVVVANDMSHAPHLRSSPRQHATYGF